MQSLNNNVALRSLLLLILVLTLVCIAGCLEKPQQSNTTTQSGLSIPEDIDEQITETTRDVVATEENWPLPGFSLPPGYELVEFKSDGENLWQATFNVELDYDAVLQHVDDILLGQGFEKDAAQPPTADGFVIRYDNPLAGLSVMFMYVPIGEESRAKFPEGIEPFDFTLGMFRNSYLVKE